MAGLFFVFIWWLDGPAYLAAGPFLTSFFRQLFLLDTQKEPKRCPLLPIAREARLKGAGFASRTRRYAPHIAPLRIQERTDWPLPGANTLRWDGAKFLFYIVFFG